MVPRASTQPSPQARRAAVEDRSAGFAHATTLGAPTIAFALLKQRTTNTSPDGHLKFPHPERGVTKG